MEKYLVIGDPVAHSRSPGMQNAAFEACSLGRPYGIRRVTPDELPAFFDFARKNLCGVNLTIPHKRAAALLADRITARAARCGSVNTLVISRGRILGDSTDGIGLERALQSTLAVRCAGCRFLLLGAGGAARAAAIHLALCGAVEITIVNRTFDHALAVAEAVKRNAPQIAAGVIPTADFSALKEAVKRANVLIQATSLGLCDDDPVPLAPELLKLNPALKVFDTIYRPTALQRAAAACGLAVAGGKEMLIRQGAASFELWTGRPAPLEAMRRGFELPVFKEEREKL